MNKKKTDSNLENQIPDSTDERFWEDFNRNLWLMFKKAETIQEELSENTTTTNIVQTSQREHCLTFAQCAEIGKQGIEPNAAQKSHIETCRLCARRIAKFGELPKVQLVTKTTENKIVQKNQPTNYFSELFRFAWSPKKIVWATLMSIILLGTMAIIFFVDLNSPNEQLGQIPESVNVTDPPINQITNENVNNKILEINTNVAPMPKVANKQKEINKNTNTTPSQIVPEEFTPDLAFLERNERDAVWQSLEAGKINPSTDLALLLKDTTVRDGNQSSIELRSPKGEAVEEFYPRFSWQDSESEGNKYQVVVRTQGFQFVANSGDLEQNSWRIDKRLPPGFYFWQVLVQKKGTDNFQPVREAFFKVISSDERSQIDKAKQKTKSHLVTAILYARAGLLKKAEEELYAELKKNPNSVKAKRMLRQVNIWRKK